MSWQDLSQFCSMPFSSACPFLILIFLRNTEKSLGKDSPIKTVPTGFSSFPPFGPAMPETDSPIWLLAAEQTPPAIWQTVGMLTAPKVLRTFFFNAQKRMFKLVAVRQNSALKPCACAAYLRDSGSEQSACAGFSNCQTHFELRQKNAEFMAQAGAHAVKIEKRIFGGIFRKA